MEALAIAGAAAVIPANDLRFSLFDDFVKYIDRGEKTTRTYYINLRQFAAWLQYAAIARPTKEDIISYRDYLSAEHDAIQIDRAQGWTYRTDRNGNRQRITCKPSTVAQYMRSIIQFFRWTAEKGLYPNIAENVHPPKIRHDTHRKEALNANDVLIIEQSIKAQAAEKATAAGTAAKDAAGRANRADEQGKRDFAMFVLAVNAGLRTIELSRANIKDLETRNGRAVIYIWGKGHAEPDTKKPIAPEVYQVIKEYLESRSDRPTANSPLFVATGNRSGGRRIAETTISKILKRSMQAAGYDSDRITAHTLRHTAGTNVQEITGDLYQTQKYMRHANPATTEIYLHNDTEQRQAETAQELYNFYHGIADKANSLQKLESIAQGMSTAQLDQLAAIAAAMAR